MVRNSKEPSKINTVQDLGSVKFGHQFPRHGLKLLHWLANNMVKFDNTRKMWAQKKPEDGHFGFHPFHNSERILPDPPFQSSYFEVGNLHAAGARSLPFGEDQSGNSESNTDRIILSVDLRMQIGSVYITEHTPHNSQFSAKDTYRLSDDLICSIKGKLLENFLRQAGYVPGETNKKAPVSSTVQWDSGYKDFLRQAGYVPGETNKKAPVSSTIQWDSGHKDFPRQAGYVPGETNKKAPVSSTVQWDSGHKDFLRQAGYVPDETNKKAPNKKAPVSSTVQWDSGHKDFMRQAGYDRDETVPNKRALNESVSIHIPDESSVTFIEDEEEDTQDLLQGHPVQRNFSTDHEDSNCCCCIIL